MKKHKDGTLPKQTSDVWVFGSNDAGIHGAGAAKIARTIYDRPNGANTAYGLYTSSNLQESYAIATKDEYFNVHSLSYIRPQVDIFISYVIANSRKEFFLTRLGCGLAGYEDEQIAPMFTDLKDSLNLSFPESWAVILENK